jgi:superfamily II DNA or RNA helicase
VYAFLDSLSVEVLESATRDLAHIEIERVGGEHQEQYRARLYRVLFANVGFDILYEKRVRRALLETLNIPVLQDLCRRHHIKTDSNRSFDLAVLAASIPWRAGTAFAAEFGRVFSVGPAYLPRREDRPLTIEIIEPSEELPELFPYQKEMKRRVDAVLADGAHQPAMLQLPTGAGKTRTVVEALTDITNENIARDKRRLFLWLAHTEELCDQAAETIVRIWRRRGLYRLSLVRFWGDASVDLDAISGAAVVASFSKLLSWRRERQDWRFINELFSTVVIDEAHRALAPTVKEMVDVALQARRATVLGLTATPGRGESDKKESRRLAELFGNSLLVPTSLGPDPIATLQENGVLARLKWEVLETNIEPPPPRDEEGENGAIDVPPRLLRLLAASEDRNALIVERVCRGVDTGLQVLIYACTVEHAKVLASMLAVRGVAAASIDAKMRESQRRSIVTSFRRGETKVLGNFGVLSTGFDAPNISMIVVCRPTSSAVLYAQMVGRGLRGPRAGGTSECVVVDVRDNFINYGDLAGVYASFGEYWKTQQERPPSGGGGA